MPGLAFLGKKSWHTSNLKNVEQVWLAEQKADDEKKKLGELRKQIEEERQIQELRQLQVASGQVVKTVDTTLDWMYEGPAAHSEQTAEEYLLGKVYKPKENDQTDLHKLAKDPGSLWLNKVSSKNDVFTRLHEDPLLVMKQNEIDARKQVLNNPVKMARIQHQISADLERIEREKREKKASKKEKKAAKKHKRQRSESYSPTRQASKHTHRRSRSRDRDQHSRSRSSDSYEGHSMDRRRGRGRDREGEREKGRDDDRNGYRDIVRNKDRDRRDDSDDSRDKSKKVYGLIGGGGASKGPSRSDDGSLGPNAKLVAMKDEQEKEKERSKFKPRGEVKKLSEEERLRRLKEMEDDARINEELRLNRLRNKSGGGRDGNKDISNAAGATGSLDAKFIHDMRSDIYNTGNTSMEDRLSRNRHYTQKGVDLDSQGFMKR